MFKVGQKVVFVDCNLPRNPEVVYPQINEIVTIQRILYYPPLELEMFTLKEYPLPVRGDINAIISRCFRPVDQTFAEETIKKILEQIHQAEDALA